jgi:hypothetical protein
MKGSDLKTYGKVEVQVNLFFTSAVNGGKCLATHPQLFKAEDIVAGTY